MGEHPLDGVLHRLGAPAPRVAYKSAVEAMRERDLGRPLLLPWRCKVCGRRFDCERLRDRHFLHHGEQPFLCPLMSCALTFCSETVLHEHVREKHPGSLPFICESCGHGFGTCCALHQHTVCHSQLLRCPEPSCDRVLGSRLEHIDHGNRHMGLVPMHRLHDLSQGVLQAARLARTARGTEATAKEALTVDVDVAAERALPHPNRLQQMRPSVLVAPSTSRSTVEDEVIEVSPR